MIIRDKKGNELYSVVHPSKEDLEHGPEIAEALNKLIDGYINEEKVIGDLKIMDSRIEKLLVSAQNQEELGIYNLNQARSLISKAIKHIEAYQNINKPKR